MNETSSRRLVTGLALSVWTLTVVIIGMTIIELANWRFFTADGWELFRGTPLFTAFINMLFVAAFGIAVGYGLLKRKRWGRLLAIVFSTLVLVDLVVYLFSYTLNIGVLLTMVMAVGVLWLLAFHTPTKQQFRK
jgi:hypothetical protein